MDRGTKPLATLLCHCIISLNSYNQPGCSVSLKEKDSEVKQFTQVHQQDTILECLKSLAGGQKKKKKKVPTKLQPGEVCGCLPFRWGRRQPRVGLAGLFQKAPLLSQEYCSFIPGAFAPSRVDMEQNGASPSRLTFPAARQQEKEEPGSLTQKIVNKLHKLFSLNPACLTSIPASEDVGNVCSLGQPCAQFKTECAITPGEK